MDSDYVPPPPSYTEQEFDQKVSQATTLSILTPAPNVDEDGWERYDPTAFERAPALPSGSVRSNTVNSPASFSSSSKGNGLPLNHQSSSQDDKPNSIRRLPSIVPLRIEKKSQPHYDSSYTSQDHQIPLESKSSAHSCHTFSKSIPGSSSAGPFSPNVYCEQIPTYEHQNIPTIHSIPPPSFDRTSSYAPSVLSAGPIHPGNDEDAFDPYRDYQTSQPYPPARQSLPVTPRPHSAIQRPASHTRSRSEAINSPPTPRLQFDPSVVYGKATLNAPMTAIQAIHSSLPSPAKPNAQYDAHSFYNSSVSSKMVPIRPSQGDTYYQAPPYEQANQQGPNLHQYQQLRNGPQSQVPSAWQSPLRPTSHYHSTPNTPRPVSSTDSNRFSQYSSGSSRDSVYSTQSDRYPLR
ncbi:hypothetical protein CVT25_011190 [Psilocybe cyanescens]|uniref:Uncharacterized protein n=1 Tax=Psilocybe cyanescens TaxID=93625 RepID=A0A409WGY7_PSICY|nr:hypothetical protein CVT25_011190 [Psilocybe cyanescens]